MIVISNLKIFIQRIQKMLLYFEVLISINLKFLPISIHFSCSPSKKELGIVDKLREVFSMAMESKFGRITQFTMDHGLKERLAEKVG